MTLTELNQPTLARSPSEFPSAKAEVSKDYDQPSARGVEVTTNYDKTFNYDLQGASKKVSGSPLEFPVADDAQFPENYDQPSARWVEVTINYDTSTTSTFNYELHGESEENSGSAFDKYFSL